MACVYKYNDKWLSEEEILKVLSERKEFKSLYNNLLKELDENPRAKEVLDRIKRDYNIKEKPKSKNYNLIDKNTNSDIQIIQQFSDYWFKEYNETLNRGKQFNTNEELEILINKEQNKHILGNYTLEEQQEEAIVELLGLMTAEKLDAVKDGKLISLLKRLLKEMKQFVRSLINQKEVEIDKLPDNMTLGDIADLLAYSNSKLILPGNEVIYTTPDNKTFKTYQEASNHISELAKSVEDVDLSDINFDKPVNDTSQIDKDYWRDTVSDRWNSRVFIKRVDGSFYVSGHTYEDFTQEQINTIKNEKGGVSAKPDFVIQSFNNLFRNNSLNDFIEKNKEYEQSKEIIEEWKKVNNIQYNPEEVYSRGQEFVSVVGAYSNFDVKLMMQNLLQHIEDNEKAGGEFTISAFTKPIDKTIGHLERGGGKIKFKIYPQSNDILWAANTDVYSGSVWDASEKVNKDKKSELLGVSYTKYPSLNQIEAVQPNLAAIVDNLAHHHNELGIVLTGNNFRLEYDEDIPYSTKKVIDSINSILDQKYGKLVKPEIKQPREKRRKAYSVIYNGIEQMRKDTIEEAKAFVKLHASKWNRSENSYSIQDSYFFEGYEGIQPTQTNETLKESIDSVKDKLKTKDDIYGLKLTYNNGYYFNAFINRDSKNATEIWLVDKIDNQPKHKTVEEAREWEKEFLNEFKTKFKKEYTSQALINTKIAKLKEVAKKYPRSLIRSEVRPIFGAFVGNNFYAFDKDELPFQKLGSKQDIEGFKEFVENNPTVEETTTPDVEYSIFFDFPFQEESAEKINKGVKSVTVRPVNLKSGTYNIGNQVYNIKNQGLMRIEDYLSLTGLTLDEFKEKFIQDEEVKYEHIEKFLDNKVALFIYKVEPTTEKSINPQLTPYEKVIKVLKSNLKQLQIEFNKEKNEEAQSFLYEKIKSLKGRIKDLENEDNQILPFLLQQAYQHLDEAAYFVSNGDITLANNYIKTYMDVFPTEDIPENLLADIKVFNDKLSTLESSVINAAKQLIEKNSKITIGGYEQDKEFASDLLSAATSNNPLVRYAHKKVVDVLNTIDLKKNLFLRALNRNLKLLGKITDPKEFYNWMLQTDENGELTGYTVTKYNHKYIKDKFKAIPNFFKGDVKTKDLEKYIKFLKKNHNIIINEEAYKQYVQEKIDYINKTSLETAEDTLEEVKEKRIYNLLKAIDPNTFLKYVNKDSRSEVEAEWLKRFLKYTRSYITYEVTNEEYFDEKYIAIQNMDDNDPKKVFYNFYTNTIKKARLEDATVKHDVALNYIPELAEDVDIITKLTNLPYYTLSEVPEDKREYFEDPTTGESMMSIPDGNMLNRELSAKNKSYNLGEVLEKFITASINKSEKDKIENEMKIVMEVVKNQQEFRVVNNQIQYKNGKPELKDPTQNNAYNQLKYFIEATLYDKRQEKERPFGKLRYDPILEKKLKQAEIDFENGLITEQELLKIKKERDATGKVITGKKLTNTLISYTAIKSLAFNMFSGIAELFQSSSSIFIEAASGRYFNDTDVKVGYSKAISTLRDSEELQLWFDNFPLINNFGYETPSGKWVDKAFWFFRQSEKLAKSALLFSRLNAIKITDVNGQEFSLLDVIKFDENGTAYLDGDFTESFEIGSEFRNTVLNQLHALSRTLLARDNTRDPIRLNRKWYGRLAGQFRSSWLFEGITRRIGGLHVTELGEQKGYYNTVFFNNGNVDVARAIKIILAAQFHPEKLADLGIEGIDLDNVKKALREFKLAMALLLIYGLAKALAGFDDDEDEWDDVIGSDFIINSAWRFNRDLTYFVNPESAIDLIGSSPMASISTIKQGMDLLKAVAETTFGDPYLYEDTKRERLKIGARIEPLIPVYSGVASTIKKFTESD